MKNVMGSRIEWPWYVVVGHHMVMRFICSYNEGT